MNILKAYYSWRERTPTMIAKAYYTWREQSIKFGLPFDNWQIVDGRIEAYDGYYHGEPTYGERYDNVDDALAFVTEHYTDYERFEYVDGILEAY